MKVAELFAELGFKIEGEHKLDSVVRGMGRGEVSAKGLAFRIGAVTTAFIAMIATSMHAGAALRNFVLSTGLSSDKLQEWQQRAAANGIAVNTLTDAVKALQTAQSNFALGEPESLGVWSMLGVDPRQDPFKVIESLRKRAGSFNDPAVFRNLLGRVGLEGLLPLIKSTNVEFEKWNKTFIVTKKETEQLTKLNAQWQILKMSVSSTKTQFSAVLAPALEQVLKLFTWLVSKVSMFVHWLESSTPAANALRTALQIILPILALLGAGIAAAFAVGPLILFIVPLAKALAVALLLVVAFDDIITSLTGGKGLMREWGEAIGEWLSKFELVAKLVAGIDYAIKTMMGSFDPNSEAVKRWRALAPQAAGALPTAASTAGAGSSQQTNNIDITVHEAKDAKSTAREVSRIFSEQYRNALSQAPAAMGH